MSAAGWQNLWGAHSDAWAEREAAEPERPVLAKRDPQAEWESPEQYLARIAGPAPRRRRRPARPQPGPDESPEQFFDRMARDAAA